MSLIIDLHAHALPDPLEKLAHHPRLAALTALAGPIRSLRKSARYWLKPVSGSLHRAQSYMRHIPEPVRKKLDALGGLVPLPALMIESNPADLDEAMTLNGVSAAVVIAHPPYAPNDWVLEVCATDPTRFIAAVNIPPEETDPAGRLAEYAERGAKLLKIHPAADGEDPSSPRYRQLLEKARELHMPVILHTGCFHSQILFKRPEFGEVERFKTWFSEFKDLKFVLAHMNFHQPEIALDLACEHDNLLVGTSWQPTEIIGEAVRRIGSERVFFGSDWPFIGNNMAIGIHRVRECIDSGMIQTEDAERILGLNARRLLGLACP